MKSKILFFTAFAIGMAAVVAAGSLSNNYRQARAYNDEDGYVATDDHFSFVSHNNNALKKAYNGNDNDSTRASNVTITNMDKTSTISWKVSIAKYSYDSIKNLKLGNSTSTIKNHADSEFAEIFSEIGVSDSHYVSALYSTTRISNVTDISLTWGAFKGNLHSDDVATGDLYFLYKLEDGSWTKIGRESKGVTKYYLNGYYGTDDTNAKTSSVWNQHIGYFSESTISVLNSSLYGHNAQIAIAYDAGTDSSKNFVCIQSLMINRINSIKSQLHYWDKSGSDSELCSGISNPTVKNNHILGMFAYNLTSDHVSALNVAANFEFHNAKEPTYYSELYYLCTQAGYTGLPVIPQSSFNGFFAESGNNGGSAIIVLSITLCGVVALVILLNKKKKHN